MHCLNFEKGATTSMGSHNAPVSCMQWSRDNNLLYTGILLSPSPLSRPLTTPGSWDATLGSWDTRTSTPASAPIGVSGKVYSLSLTSTRVVVATSDRHITVFDKRNLSVPEQIRESPLRYLTRQISCFPNGEGFVIGSIEVDKYERFL